MNCDQVRGWISPMIDGELDPRDEEQIKQHLQGCSACHRYWSELTDVDHDLQQLQLPKLSCARSVELHPGINAKKAWLRWTVAVAIAASGLIAIVMLQNHFLQKQQVVESSIDDSTNAPPSSASNVATLIRQTGPVESLVDGRWIVTPQNNRFAIGSRLRTPPETLCELRTGEGSVLRLDSGSELEFRESSELALVVGRIYVQGSLGESIRLMIQDPNGLWEAQCPKGAQLQVVSRENRMSCDVLSKHDLSWSGGSQSVTVNAGETVQWNNESEVIRSKHQISRSKLWQLPLIAVDGPSESIEGEMNAILKPLLTHVGRTKAQFMDEQQIRALGPSGALPLLMFALSDSSKNDPDQRIQAISIASELADENAIELLEQLELDENSQISRIATDALRRIQNKSVN